MGSDLALAPWTDARKAFGERRIAFRLLRPPYAAAGEGALRVLRVRDGDPVEILCGYERYRKL